MAQHALCGLPSRAHSTRLGAESKFPELTFEHNDSEDDGKLASPLLLHHQAEVTSVRGLLGDVVGRGGD